MNLKTYIQQDKGNGTKLAQDLGINPSFLSQMASGNRAITAERASAIERATSGQVTRQELRPEDWQAIWPELVKRRKPAATVAA
jgi:DNA-binding transcriptional regulator YdaS (Cro superfamily)